MREQCKKTCGLCCAHGVCGAGNNNKRLLSKNCNDLKLYRTYKIKYILAAIHLFFQILDQRVVVDKVVTTTEIAQTVVLASAITRVQAPVSKKAVTIATLTTVARLNGLVQAGDDKKAYRSYTAQI